MNEVLERFIAKAPVSVMVRATLLRVLSDTTLDELFERHAQAQYTRDLAFSTVTRLMTKVVFSIYPSVHAAFLRAEDEIPVSVTSLYNKIDGLETGVSQALVGETAASMDEIITALPGTPETPVNGLRLRTLDGNFLAGTEHRLDCLRDSGAAALPGMSLVVRDGRTGLLTDLIPCEDAYTAERSLHPEILALVHPDDLWLMDRNFCTNDYLEGMTQRQAYFLVRHHAGTILHPMGPETDLKETSESTISEQRVRAGAVECRCIIIRLKKALRDGTTEIRLLTNVPAHVLDAQKAANLYRTRWKIESAFQELTDNLCCEIKTLAYPKAALFGFALAVVAYNLLVVTRTAMASGLEGEGVTESSVSSYHMAVEVDAFTEGLSIALPEPMWQRFVEMTAKEFAAWLDAIASTLNWRKYRKKPRGPKKPAQVIRTNRGAHRSTARVIKESKK